MKPERNMNLAKEEKKRVLEVQFWNDKQKIDKTSKLNKKIEKICKNIDFNK
jgi:hypothetical protein